MLTLYDYLPSQNAYKVRLLLNQLNRPYRTKMISIFEGEGQTEEFRKISPAGAVPAIELENGSALAESNAILIFLAEGSAYLPDDAFNRAKVLQWLFFEGETVQGGVATLRHWVQTGKDKKRSPELIAMKRDLSLKSLRILDRELSRNDFLGGNRYTVADMSVFAYVHLAGEANLPLEDYGHVVRWIERVRSQAGFLAETHPYSIDPYSVREL
ncbi:MAG: glutathione S-transferase family protein [Alphaproteobacteria bacterium]|nr:glutathione S-transferase family protein [Alphaproteobacteria bacterium]